MTWLKSYMPSAPGGSFCYVTSTEEESDHGASIYPNPTVDGKIQIESHGGPLHVTVRDLFGRKIKTEEIPARAVTVVELDDARGVYIVEMKNNLRTTYQRIVVK
jgi:hypothetical protein